MFKSTQLLYIYTETPLHVGAGRGMGAIDLPIQREGSTGYPMVQASGLKGCLRAAYRSNNNLGDEDPKVTALFGKSGGENDNHAGAIAPGDARILLFPVRSLAGVMAWITSRDALARFMRDAERMGTAPNWQLPDVPGQNQCRVSDASALKAGNSVVLEEFSYTPLPDDKTKKIADWLADNALPTSDDYAYWKAELKRKLVLLPEDDFRDFTQHATEIQTHIKIDPATKTVRTGALWLSESVPIDALFYAPLMATDSRNSEMRAAKQLLLDLALPKRLQLGGDETTGQGWVAIRQSEVKHV